MHIHVEPYAHSCALPKFAHLAEALAKRRFTGLGSRSFRRQRAPTYLGIHFGFVIVIPGERRVNLRQRQMRMLEMNFFRTPPVGDHVQCHLDDFRIRVVNPRDVALIEPNMGRSQNRHNQSVTHALPCGNEVLSRPIHQSASVRGCLERCCPVVQIGYRLYLFFGEFHCQRDVNHIGAETFILVCFPGKRVL